MKNKQDVFGAYLTNQAHYSGYYEFPEVGCAIDDYPDYICLYSETRNYHKTKNTAVGFFVDDYKFDSLNGLYNSIRANDEVQLEKYKKRFEGCAFVIAPDYSTYSDMPLYEQINNIAKSRLVFLWLTLKCRLLVIPFAGWGSEETLSFCFDGIQKNSVVAISLKGAMNNSKSIELAKKAINKLISQTHPKAIIIYTVCSDELLHIFTKSLSLANTIIIVPDNLLKERNKILQEVRHGI